MTLGNVRKAVVACASAVIGVLALFNVDASSTVDTIAQAILVLVPLFVYAVPNDDAS